LEEFAQFIPDSPGPPVNRNEADVNGKRSEPASLNGEMKRAKMDEMDFSTK